MLLLNLPHGRTFAISHKNLHVQTFPTFYNFLIIEYKAQGCLLVTRLNLARVNLKNYTIFFLLACVNEGAPGGGCSAQRGKTCRGESLTVRFLTWHTKVSEEDQFDMWRE